MRELWYNDVPTAYKGNLNYLAKMNQIIEATVARIQEKPGYYENGAFVSATKTQEHIRKLEEELSRTTKALNNMRDAERATSEAYLRVRRQLHAFNTPRGATPQEIYKYVEALLDERLKDKPTIVKGETEVLEGLATTFHRMSMRGFKGPAKLSSEELYGCMFAEHTIRELIAKERNIQIESV